MASSESTQPISYEASHDTEAIIKNLEQYLLRRQDEFEQTEGRAPTRDDIATCLEWNEAYEKKREWEYEVAKSQYKEGYCSVYIPRRRRFCALRAADNCNGKCTAHFELEIQQQQQQQQDDDKRNNEEPDSKRSKWEDNKSSSSRQQLEDAREAGNEKWKLKSNIHRRMKKMTNPLAIQFQKPLCIPDWSIVFQNPALPCLVDIGCAKGRFLQKLAQSERFVKEFGPHNFVGVEIFEPLVTAANKATQELGLKNLYYVHGSANTSNFEDFLRSVSLSKVCIQFPDPWFDDKACRRVLTSALVDQIAAALCAEGQLYIVSDVLELALDMRRRVLLSGKFRFHSTHVEHGSEKGWGEVTHSDNEIVRSSSSDAEAGHAGSGLDAGSVVPLMSEEERQHQWLRVRPYFEATERDQVCELKPHAAIYRMLFQKI